MNISDLINKGIPTLIPEHDIADLNNILATFQAGSLGITDFDLAKILSTSTNLFLGNTGDLDKHCYDLIVKYSKMASDKMPKGVDTVIVPTLDNIWTTLPEPVLYSFKKAMFYQVKSRVLDKHLSISDAKLKELLDDKRNPLLTFEYLNRAVGLFITKTKEKDKVTGEYNSVCKRKITLCTRSIALLYHLNTLGMLDIDPEKNPLASIDQRLWSIKDMEALIKENKAYIVKLECTKVKGNGANRMPVFSCSFVKGRVAMYNSTVVNEETGTQTSTYFYPISVVYAEELYLKQMFSKGVYDVVKDSDYGEKSSKITSSPDIIRSLYQKSGVSATDIDKTCNKLWGNMSTCYTNRNYWDSILVGFDIATLRYYFVDAEASIHGANVWGIKPGALNRYRLVNPAEVNRSMYSIDNRFINQIFNTRVTRAKLSDFACLPAFLNLGSLRYKREKCEALLAYGNSLSDFELYNFVTNPANAPFFGDVQYQYQMRMRNNATYLKESQPLDLTVYKENPSAKLADIKKLLSERVLRLTILSTKHIATEVLATNNEKLLMKTYGDDYVGIFENPRRRMQLFINALDTISSNVDTLSKEEMQSQIVAEFSRLHLEDRYSSPDEIKTLLSKSILDIKLDIGSKIDVLKEKAKKTDPDTIYYRVADGYKIVTSAGFPTIIRQCNVANIIGVEICRQVN